MVDSYENLILLCATHHLGVIDDVERREDWTIDDLLKMKARHEASVKERLGRISEFDGSVSVSGENVGEFTGVRVRKPTRFRSGSNIHVSGRNIEKMTGLEIGGALDE
jgi:hypothetical protein